MKPNKELLLIALFSFTSTGSIRSEPAASPPVVVERGLFYRVWQTSNPTTGSPPGEAQSRTGTYTELGNGLCYQENGQWLDSQDLIELDGNVGIARRGPTKVTFNANINSPDAVDLVTVSGKRLQTRVIGLYYFDAKTGETTTIALVKDSTGVLHAPNQVAYTDAFDRVSADIVYTYAKGGFDQTIVLLEPLPTPEAYGLNSSWTRLQVHTELLQAPPPVIRQRVLKRQPDAQLRQSMVSPDLTDEILDFGDLWFPTGAAFRWNSNLQARGGQPAAVRVPDQSDPENILIGKQWTNVGDKNVLIESVDYLDIAPKLSAALKTATLK